MKIAARIHALCVSFNKRHVLHNVAFCAPAAGITVLAGRSGSGKTTLLRALNRLNETFPRCRTPAGWNWTWETAWRPSMKRPAKAANGRVPAP